MTTATEPRERPILFSDAMVQAILAGRKTQTRRVVKPAPVRVEAHDERVGTTGDGKPIRVHCPTGWRWRDTYAADGVDFGAALRAHCPYGAPGDRLWVREAWAAADYQDRTAPWEMGSDPDSTPIWWRADGDVQSGRGRWRPSIHMPRWASRLTLEVVSVRVERLQAITEEDAEREGLLFVDGRWESPGVDDSAPCARDAFAWLWDSINADRAPWASSPWVWVVEFRRVRR